MLILIVSNRLGNLTLEPVNGQVHLRDADRRRVFFLTVEDDFLCSVSTFLFYEVARLNEHSTRAGGKIANNAVFGFDDVHDELHERRRSKKFPIVMRFLNRKLGEEILVDAPEDVAACLLDPLAIEQAHQILEDLRLENAVLFWQDA